MLEARAGAVSDGPSSFLAEPEARLQRIASNTTTGIGALKGASVLCMLDVPACLHKGSIQNPMKEVPQSSARWVLMVSASTLWSP